MVALMADKMEANLVASMELMKAVERAVAMDVKWESLKATQRVALTAFCSGPLLDP